MSDLDDIDDLLDEVETKFGLKENNKQKAPWSTKSTTTTARTKKKSELDDIINDIFEDDGLDTLINKKAHMQTTSTKASPTCSSKTRCALIYVGGINASCGPATHSNQLACDRLHCLKCDCKIVHFDNFKWDESHCDYLAFRNNYPDYERLKGILIPRKGFRAYCCQCSWLTANKTEELSVCKPGFKWMCRKH